MDPQTEEKNYTDRAKLWIAKKSTGREKILAGAMVLTAFAITGYMIWKVYFNESYEKETLSEVIERIQPSESFDNSSVSFSNINKIYEEYGEDQELLEMIEELQAELDRTDPDMAKIEALYNEIKSHLYEKD